MFITNDLYEICRAGQISHVSTIFSNVNSGDISKGVNNTRHRLPHEQCCSFTDTPKIPFKNAWIGATTGIKGFKGFQLWKFFLFK